MQDTNPDYFEVRDVKFEELDVEKGTALVDFVLWSSIQTVREGGGFWLRWHRSIRNLRVTRCHTVL